MTELRQRLALVDAVLGRGISTGFEAFDTELVFIQFRKVLENMAFGSLVANKDKYSAAYAKFADHWNAKRMLLHLEQVNPDFYPRPVQLVESKPIGLGKKFHTLANVQDGFMTKDEFITLYEKCGAVLHVRNPYSSADPVINIGHTAQHRWSE